MKDNGWLAVAIAALSLVGAAANGYLVLRMTVAIQALELKLKEAAERRFYPRELMDAKCLVCAEDVVREHDLVQIKTDITHLDSRVLVLERAGRAA